MALRGRTAAAGVGEGRTKQRQLTATRPSEGEHQRRRNEPGPAEERSRQSPAVAGGAALELAWIADPTRCAAGHGDCSPALAAQRSPVHIRTAAPNASRFRDIFLGTAEEGVNCSAIRVAITNTSSRRNRPPRASSKPRPSSATESSAPPPASPSSPARHPISEQPPALWGESGRALGGPEPWTRYNRLLGESVPRLLLNRQTPDVDRNRTPRRVLYQVRGDPSLDGFASIRYRQVRSSTVVDQVGPPRAPPGVGALPARLEVPSTLQQNCPKPTSSVSLRAQVSPAVIIGPP